MKKNCAYVKIKWIILLLFLVCISQAFTAPCGDVNSDGVINIIDALMTAQYYVGLPVAGFDQTAADVSGDGKINIVDALYLAQYYVGLIDELPACTAPITPSPTPVKTQPPIVTAPPGVKGYININDPVPGWASMSGGTTGGGTNLSSAVTVSTMSALNSEASGSGSKIILVKPGTYNGSFEPGANKTIIGTAPGVTIQGRINISGSDKNNIIVRNIAVRGNSCSSDDDCRSGDDAVYIGNGAHHIWFDHCDVADGQDGNFDITKEGDYVTISWTKLWYTKVKPHAQCSLIAGSDTETQSRGKLQITYMNCWWGANINARQPRGRFGKVHCFNNYHNSQGGIHGVGKEMALIAENNYYDTPGKSIFSDMGSPAGWKGIGNEGSAKGMNDSRGSVFTIPYKYAAIPASQVKAAVTASVGGAGNTVTLQM